jgi:hypothetical protein
MATVAGGCDRYPGSQKRDLHPTDEDLSVGTLDLRHPSAVMSLLPETCATPDPMARTLPNSALRIWQICWARLQGNGKFTLLFHAPQRRWLLECTSWRSYEAILPSRDSS